jgi:hypothetical protein
MSDVSRKVLVYDEDRVTGQAGTLNQLESNDETI